MSRFLPLSLLCTFLGVSSAQIIACGSDDSTQSDDDDDDKRDRDDDDEKRDRDDDDDDNADLKRLLRGEPLPFVYVPDGAKDDGAKSRKDDDDDDDRRRDRDDDDDDKTLTIKDVCKAAGKKAERYRWSDWDGRADCEEELDGIMGEVRSECGRASSLRVLGIFEQCVDRHNDQGQVGECIFEDMVDLTERCGR